MAEGACCVMVRPMYVYLVRLDQTVRCECGHRLNKPAVAIVDNEEHARELERMGYQRAHQEVEEHDRGSDGCGAGSR